MAIIDKIDKIDKILFLPILKEAEEIKWDSLREKLRIKIERYFEGLGKFKTIGEAMKYSGIGNRQSLCDYRNEIKGFEKKEIEIIKSNYGDINDCAEKGLFKAILAGDLRAITYFLDRKNDGYRPKGDFNMNNPKEINKQRNELNNIIQNAKARITTIRPNN